MKINGILLLSLLQSSLQIYALNAAMDKTDTALTGRTYFTTHQPLQGKRIKARKDYSSSSSDSTESASTSSSNNDINSDFSSSSDNRSSTSSSSDNRSSTSSSSSDRSSTSSSSSQDTNFNPISVDSSDGLSSTSSSSSASSSFPAITFNSLDDEESFPSTSTSTDSSETLTPIRPVANFQRPWCPGQVLAGIVSRAMDPIYNWKDQRTCEQFAGNYGGISVLVGELGAEDFCSFGSPVVFSNYTIVRSLSINEPIYARVNYSLTEYATAAGPILYPEGLVYYIAIAREVTTLPQVCCK
jgi:hypothetical protein